MTTARERIEAMRVRARGGALFTCEQIAKELGIPVEEVMKVALCHFNRPDGFIPAPHAGETKQ
jgi:hypothetical protein